MTQARHIDRIVRAVYGYVKPAVIGDGSGYEAALRAYETQAGLTAFSLTNPAAYRRAFVPKSTESPLIQIYDGPWLPSGPAGQRLRLWAGDVTIAFAYTGDADIEVAEDMMRAYVAAMVDFLEASPTLGGRINASIITDGDRAHSMVEQDSSIRHVRGMGLKVVTSDS